MLTVLCYGDSNTFGYVPAGKGRRYPENVRWTGILSDKLGDGFRVIEEGLIGRTTAYPRPGCRWKNGYNYLLPCLYSHMPVDIVIFMLGTNDCGSDLSLNSDSIAKGMAKLIRATKRFCLTSQGFAPRIILVAPPAMHEDADRLCFSDSTDSLSVEKSRMLGKLYGQLAEKTGCEYYDGTWEIEVSDLDGVHITENGHWVLADKMYRIIAGVK